MAAVAATESAAAQESSALIDRLRACSEMRRESARLECYDALANASHAATAAAAPATRTSTLPAAAALAPRTSAATATQDNFGFAPKPAEPQLPPAAEQELTSRVAALRELLPGRLEITLVNGQIWRQTNSDRYPLEIGHEVRIYPSRFGSYFRLSAAALRSFVQVERVR
jgi:hypothetical protein